MQKPQAILPTRVGITLVVLFFTVYIAAVTGVLAVFTQQYNKQYIGFMRLARPDFTSFELVSDKKRAFFDYIGVLADAENQRVKYQRGVLLAIRDTHKLGQGLGRGDLRRIAALSKEYRLPVELSLEEQISELLLRVNIVPRALVQAQAAIESGWGTSRFAIAGNNLFGQWCFSKGCGIVPSSRVVGKAHEVAVFKSDAHAIRAYLLNLNGFAAYGDFREMRAGIPANELGHSAFRLAASLLKYSERGEAYVREVQHMIKANNIEPKHGQQ